MKSRFSKLIEKDGFYIILFICVCVVAITAVLTSRGNLNKPSEDNLSKAEDLIILEEDEIEPSLEIVRMEEDLTVEDETAEESEEIVGETEEDDVEEDMDFVEDEEEEHIPPKATEIEMILPVEGKLGMDFTKDNLIYSETLEEWTNHNGVDIFAKEGTTVKAALSGRISEIYEDDLWGIVILIDHGNGFMTKYANLSTKEMVKEGHQVNQGDGISKVGKSAPIEMIMEPHIHFEVIKEGKTIDPKSYLPAFSYSN